MKSKLKFFFTTFCVILSFIISSCTTIDSLQEAISSLFESQNSNIQNNETQKIKKVSSTMYKIPEDYEKYEI